MYEDAHLEEAYEDRFIADEEPFDLREAIDALVPPAGPTAEERDAMLDEQEQMKAELEAEARLAYYDDDPSPYDGTYSEC